MSINSRHNPTQETLNRLLRPFRLRLSLPSIHGKAEAMETDLRAPDRDGRMGAIKVQFFGDSVAVAYGNESSLRKGKDGKASRRCLAWTDTWLKRAEKWQVVAAQDAVVTCR